MEFDSIQQKLWKKFHLPATDCGVLSPALATPTVLNNFCFLSLLMWLCRKPPRRPTPSLINFKELEFSNALELHWVPKPRAEVREDLMLELLEIDHAGGLEAAICKQFMIGSSKYPRFTTDWSNHSPIRPCSSNISHSQKEILQKISNFFSNAVAHDEDRSASYTASCKAQNARAMAAIATNRCNANQVRVQ